MKDPVADSMRRNRLRIDHQTPRLRRGPERPLGGAGLHPLPARRVVGGGVGGAFLQHRPALNARNGAGRGRAIVAAVKTGGRQHLHMVLWQLVDKAGGQGALPLVIDPPVRSEADRQVLTGAGDADIGEAAFLLQSLQPALIHRALRREEPILPTRQKHTVELQTLGGVIGHQRDLLHRVFLLILHDQRDVLQEALKVLEFIKRLDKLFEILQPPRRLRRFVPSPVLHISEIFEDLHGAFDMVEIGRLRPLDPSVEQADDLAQRLLRRFRNPAFLGADPRAFEDGNAVLARRDLHRLLRLVAKAAFRRVHDPLEGQPVVG